MEKKETKLQKGIDNFGALLMFILIMVTFLQVVFRYVLGRPLPWSEEAARYFMIWLALIGSAMAIFTGEHINVEFFFAKLPHKPQFYFRVLNKLITCLFWGIIMYYGFSFAWMNRVQASSAMPWLSMFWVCLPIPLGALIALAYRIKDLVATVRSYPRAQCNTQTRGVN